MSDDVPAQMTTESRNLASLFLDRLPTDELVALLHQEDRAVGPAIGSQLPAISRSVDAIVEKLQAGGRLIYIGAGTSGRLGVLDAAECPPTFRTPPDMVVGIIAGGTPALTRAVEGAEDNTEQAVHDLQAIHFSKRDVLVCIASSGRTPYVLRAAEYAKDIDALTIGISCNTNVPLNQKVDIPIVPVVGPEVITGSTRMKAGTATKLILNMLSTAVMVRLGKTYGNLMVDLKPTNAKLHHRAIRMLKTITGLDDQNRVELLLKQTDGEVKTAIVMHFLQTDAESARVQLKRHQGRVEQTIGLTEPGYASCFIVIDGGGSKTIAVLAEKKEEGVTILGQGFAGPSNIQSVGKEAARLAIRQAISQAFHTAQLPFGRVYQILLGLAGSFRAEEREIWQRWCEETGLANVAKCVSDVELLFSATKEQWGIAIIAGTGSIVYGKDQHGRTDRAGGWGYLLGDEGSGYHLAIEGLKSTLHDQSSAMLPLFQKALRATDPADLIPRFYAQAENRSTIAELSEIVFRSSQQGDAIAHQVLRRGIESLAEQIAVVHTRLFSGSQEIPLILSGSLLIHHASYRQMLLESIKVKGWVPKSVQIVENPAINAALNLSRQQSR